MKIIILMLPLLLILPGCTTITPELRDKRLTVDCPLVPLPAGPVGISEYEDTIIEQWTEVMGCTDRFRVLRAR